MEGWELGCDGECESCDDYDCPEHPANAHLYRPLDVCPYGGLGCYVSGAIRCEMCGDREACGETAEEIDDEESGGTEGN